jgi:hypothetical protein
MDLREVPSHRILEPAGRCPEPARSLVGEIRENGRRKGIPEPVAEVALHQRAPT